QRVRDARPRPCGRSRLPRLAAAPLRLSPGAEPAVVHRVLVPGLRRLGGDHAPAGHPVPPPPDPADRRPPLQRLRDAGGDDRAARRDPRRRLHRTGDHELHAAHLEPPRAVGWAEELDVVSLDHYLDTTGPDAEAHVAYGSDLARSWSGGPW